MNQIIFGDCRESMQKLIEQGTKVQMCVTSPPYFGLRDYGVSGQLGLESTVDEYVENMVQVFRLVRELLHDDGTLWLNLGDSYASNSGGYKNSTSNVIGKGTQNSVIRDTHKLSRSGLKPKDLNKGAHFATYPPDLIEPCVLAGSRVRDIVFDPFMGSGTTAAVALIHERQYLGCELNPEYEILQTERLNSLKKEVA